MKHRRGFALGTALILGLSLHAVAWGETWAKAYWFPTDISGGSIRAVRDPKSGYDLIYAGQFLRISEKGEILLQKQFTDERNDLRVLSVTREGGFVLAGGHNYVDDSDSAISKLDPQIKPAWNFVFSGLDSFFDIRDIRQTSDGGYIAGGTSYPFIPASIHQSVDQYSKAWLMKLGGSGKQQWKRYFKVNGLHDVRQTPDGGYAFSTFRGSIIKVSKTGAFQWQKRYIDADAQVMEASNDGGFWSVFRSANALILMKLTSTGEVLWQSLHETEGESINDIEPLADGGVLLAGSHYIQYQESTAVLYRIDSQGNATWKRTYGQPYQNLSAQQVLLAKDGGYLVVTDHWLLKTDENGSIPNSCTSLDVKSVPSMIATSFPPANRTPRNGNFATRASSYALSTVKGGIVSMSVCSPIIQSEPTRYAFQPPLEGRPLVIIGYNFGSQQDNSQVRLNNRDLGTANLWFNNMIAVTLPQVTSNSKLAVRVNGFTSNNVDLLLLPSSQQPLSPSTGVAGSRVVVLAPDYLPRDQTPQVLFGSAQATAVSFVDGRTLVCNAPPGIGTVQVQVRVGFYIRSIGNFVYSQ